MGDPSLVPGLGRSPGRGHGNPLQFCLENPHGQRSMMVYSPRGCKELDMTEQLSTAQHSTTFSTFWLLSLAEWKMLVSFIFLICKFNFFSTGIFIDVLLCNPDIYTLLFYILEKEMATHPSTLAWKIPWMEEPGRLQSMGLLRVGHNWATSLSLHFHALEKEMATHSSVLAWRIPGTGECLGLPSMGSHRVGHDWSDLAGA